MNHGNATLVHRIHRWEYADETDRLAAAGFTAQDVKKLALQLDNKSFWLLTDDSPVTWTQMGGYDLSAYVTTGSFAETVQDTVNSLLAVSAPLTKSYDDGGNSLALGFDLANSAFLEAVRDAVGSLLVAGSNVTVTVNDGADTITISSSSATTNEEIDDRVDALVQVTGPITKTYNDGSNTLTFGFDVTNSTFLEAVRDAVGALLVEGTNVTLTVNDGADTITISASAGGSGLPSGGSTGQVLAKIDGTDYNADWVTPTGAITELIHYATTAARDADSWTSSDVPKMCYCADVDKVFVMVGVISGKGKWAYHAPTNFEISATPAATYLVDDTSYGATWNDPNFPADVRPANLPGCSNGSQFTYTWTATSTGTYRMFFDYGTNFNIAAWRVYQGGSLVGNTSISGYLGGIVYWDSGVDISTVSGSSFSVVLQTLSGSYHTIKRLRLFTP